MENPVTLLYNPEEVGEIANKLNFIFTKERLVHIYTQEIRPLVTQHDVWVSHAGSTQPFVPFFEALTAKRLSTIYSLSKNDLLKIVATMLSSTNLLTWYNHLQPSRQQAWQLVLHNMFAPASTIGRLYGTSLKTDRYFNTYYQDAPLFERLKFYDRGNVYGDSYACFPYHLLSHFNTILAQDTERRDEDAEPYEPQDGAVINLEHQAQMLWTTITELYDQGIISPGKSKILTASAVKLIASHASATLPTPDGDMHDNNLCAKLIGTMATLDWTGVFSYNKARREPYRHIKVAIESMGASTFYVMPMLTQHIKGLTNNDRDRCRLSEIQANVNTIITTHHQQWLTWEEFVDNLRIINNKQSTLTGIFPRERLGAKPITTLKGDKITADMMVNHIGLPLVRAMLMTYAAMGVLEVECQPVSAAEAVSPYDCLKAFRLTELGKYVFGLEMIYTPPKVETKKLFEASSSNLIVHVLDNQSPYVHTLAAMAESIGNDRWVVTPSAMLADCQSQDDVKRKIDNFKRHIEPKPSPVWTAFFDTILARCKPLSRETLGKYYLYKVNPDNRDLVNILTSDPTVRSLVIRAEQHLLLIPVANIAKLTKRLRELGYLL